MSFGETPPPPSFSLSTHCCIRHRVEMQLPPPSELAVATKPSALAASLELCSFVLICTICRADWPAHITAPPFEASTSSSSSSCTS